MKVSGLIGLKTPALVVLTKSQVSRLIPQFCGITRPLSALIAISSPRFPDPTFPRLSLGDTQGSKNLGQADNMPVSKKQARKHGRTRRGSGKQIRITFAEASSGRVAYPQQTSARPVIDHA